MINAQEKSKLFKEFESELIDAMQSDNLLYHLHHRGVPLFNYIKYPKLNDFFKIISTDTIDGVSYISTAEAKNYPIYVTQYHPEVILDPATDLNSVKTPINFKIGQSFSNFFASECAKNMHRFNETALFEKYLVSKGKSIKIEFLREPVNAYAFDY